MKFKGYARVFNNIDTYRYVTKRGAFSKALDYCDTYPLLLEHRLREDAGIVTLLRENERGLYIEGELLKDWQCNGLSIGFSIRRSRKRRDGILELLEIDLWEISVVRFPADNLARLEIVEQNNEKEQKFYKTVLERESLEIQRAYGTR